MSNVAYTSGPVEEQEMSRVRDIFDRALNALVDASSLAKAVEGLKSDLESLKAQVTHYRNTIANQDDQITRLRQDRDAARTAQYQAEDNLRHNATDLENHKRDLDSMASSNARLNDRVSELVKERDDTQFKLLELQEAHNELSKKFDNIRSVLGLAKPEPVPVVEQPGLQQEHSSSGTVIFKDPDDDAQTYVHPEAQQEPQPVVEEPKNW